MTLSDTINLAIENSELEQQISDNLDAPKQIQTIQQKLQTIEQLIGNDTYQEIDIHQTLLEAITGFVQKNELVLQDFPQPFVSIDNGYITKTAKVTVQGDFIPLLKLLYFLEHKYQVGKVVAVDYKATNDLRTRNKELNSIIYLQNVKAENNEEKN